MNESHAAAYLPRFPSISLRTTLISSSTSSLVSSPFRTNTRRVASCSYIMDRSSSSKVTTWRGSSFSAMAYTSKESCFFCEPGYAGNNKGRQNPTHYFVEVEVIPRETVEMDLVVTFAQLDNGQ